MKADTLIVGTRQLGAFKRAFLGSVSDYLTHNVAATVIIVKVSVTSFCLYIYM